MSAFTNFSKLPRELRDMIWEEGLPTAVTIEFREDEFQVSRISPPPALLTTSKEAQATALSSLNLSTYPIWGPEDWEDIFFDADKMILQIIIDPSKSSNLNITWTDIWSVLGDALPAAKHLHIVCSKPERLARLYMLPEAEYVRVGQSCIEKGMFSNDESVSGERKTRETLHPNVTVTASKHTVEDIDKGISDEGVDVWRMVDEEISVDIGPSANIFTTKAFARVEVDKSLKMSVKQLHNAAKTSALPTPEAGEEEEESRVEEVVEKSGMELTEDALARHLEEMEKLFPKTVSEDDEKDPGGSVWPGSD
jgi:hypothetical protein